MVRLEHEVLQSVLKPARYTGGEWNAVIKDHAAVDCTWALALPDVYEVGMSNLGLAILYEVLNRREDIAAERVYAPWTDMEEEMLASIEANGVKVCKDPDLQSFQDATASLYQEPAVTALVPPELTEKVKAAVEEYRNTHEKE